MIPRTPSEQLAYLEGYTAGSRHVLRSLDAGTDPQVVRGHVDATVDLIAHSSGLPIPQRPAPTPTNESEASDA